MKAALALCLIVSAAAAPPAFTSGPTVQGVGATWAQIKWTTTQASGPTSTTTASLASMASPVAVAECANFPVNSVVRVDREQLLVTARSATSGACNLSVSRTPSQFYATFDPRNLRIWESTLTNVVANSGTCTATTPMPHLYAVSDAIQVWGGTGITDVVRTVATIPTAETFTFDCAGVSNGTYSQARMEIRQASTSHSSGATVTRVDNDAKLCVGTATGVYTLEFTPNYQSLKAASTNHFVYALALAPQTTYYVVAMSTSNGTSDCDSPGSDTVVSDEFTFTTIALVEEPEMPSESARTWGFHVGGLSYSTDVETASDCSDLQTKINAAAAADGALNHRIRIPSAAACGIGLVTLPKKTGSNPTGTGRLVLTSSDTSCLPAEGERISGVLGCMPTLALNDSAAVSFLVVSPEASYWTIRGLHLTIAPGIKTMTYETQLITSLTGNFDEYDISKDPHHIVILQNYMDTPMWNNWPRAGVRLHGDYLVVEGNDIRVQGRDSDMGAVQFDGFDTQYVYVHNNRLQAAMTGFFVGGDQLNQRDIWFTRNYITRPESWNIRHWSSQFKVQQAVASGSAGSSSTINTVYANAVETGRPVAFSGATGSWAALNYTIWSVLEGTASITVSGGTATVTTSSAHGLATGQYVTVGGAFREPCQFLNTGSGFGNPTAKAVTVTGSTTFTFTDAGYDFSTVSGDQCQNSDIRVIGPVWPATYVDNDTFTVGLNSTGFGALTGTVEIGYFLAANQKNAFELKQGRRVYIGGNIIENPWSQNQDGWLMAISPRGDSYSLQGGPERCWQCNGGVTDVIIENNVLRDGCTAVNILGSNDYGITLPVQRLIYRNNLAYGLTAASTTGSTCNRNMAVLVGGFEAVEMSHNTILATPSPSAAPSGRMWLVDGPISSSIRVKDNIAPALVGPNNGACSWAGLIEGKGCTAYSFRSWDQGRNIWFGDYRIGGSFIDGWGNSRQYMSGPTYGDNSTYQANYWPESQAQVGWQGHRAITGCTNAAPIVCTTSAAHGLANGDQVTVTGVGGNTNANGYWFVRVVSATQVALAGSIGNGTFSGDFGGQASLMPLSGTLADTLDVYRLATGSAYRAGVSYVQPGGYPGYSGAGSGPASDDTDVGADIDAIIAAIGGSEPEPPARNPFSGSIRISGSIKLQ